MTQHLSDEELWSGLDRGAVAVTEHVSTCEQCRARAAKFRAGMTAVNEGLGQTSVSPRDRIGPYVIRGTLGEGGMGIVYEAEQENPRREVALKVVRGGRFVDEYRLRLFEREAQTLGRLKHPGIAAIYHGGQTDEGEHYFVMELVRGIPLTQYVRDRQVPRRERLMLFREICGAINYAHQRGVIHRDLKPTNILVDGEGRSKILDFGLARLTNPEEGLVTTVHDGGRLMGTLPYMSPEEVRGSPDGIDVRSDVYSLGVILYELLGGQLPHVVSRAALPEAMRVICEEAPRRLGSLDRTLRGDLETITAKAMEKEPMRRYQSAAAFSEDLERFLSNQPILARRARLLYRFRKLAVRNRLFFVATLALVIAVLGIAVSLDRLESDRRAQTQRTIDLEVLRAATIENRLGDALREQGEFEQAEPWYRSALQTFRRLRRDDFVAPTLVNLVRTLLHRPGPEGGDKSATYEEAEQYLLEADDLLRQAGDGARAQRVEALNLLRALYSRDQWDDPEGLARVENQLSALQSALHRPQPSQPVPAQ